MPYGLNVNTLRPRQDGRRFPDDTFERIFLIENVIILIKISLMFVPNGPINNIPSLVQIMAWRRPGDKPLSEPMMVRLPTHICVTRPQWVKCYIWNSKKPFCHTDELVSPPYEITIVAISYGRVTKSYVWDSMMLKKYGVALQHRRTVPRKLLSQMSTLVPLFLIITTSKISAKCGYGRVSCTQIKGLKIAELFCEPVIKACGMNRTTLPMLILWCHLALNYRLWSICLISVNV